MAGERIIGVIGGSGLYEMEGLEQIERVRLTTPFGDPSDAYITGVLGGQRMVFLPRHGVGHRILPTEINFRANIWGMKKLGAGEIISVSAVGSMKENIAPGDMVLVDQFVDLTKRRVSTFYGDGVVVHVPMADPVCNEMRRTLAECSRSVGARTHDIGTYVCIEGPQFSSRGESFVYRGWGVDVIGMTNMPEAKLAREAELCYATIALATDYDCWHHSEESVTVEAVLKTLAANVANAKAIIRAYAANPPDLTASPCKTAARTSLMSSPDQISDERYAALEPIFAQFLPRRDRT